VPQPIIDEIILVFPRPASIGARVRREKKVQDYNDIYTPN